MRNFNCKFLHHYYLGNEKSHHTLCFFDTQFFADLLLTSYYSLKNSFVSQHALVSH